MTNPIELIPASSFKKAQTGKFAPKLDEAERCAILALVRSGIRREVVAEAYGVDRRTVGHIVNDASFRYKPTREEYKKLGHQEFIKLYLTEAVALKVAAVTKPDTADAKPVKKEPSPRASRMAGIHEVQPEQCEYKHKVEIKFVNGGWHYRDTSGGDPDVWLHNGDESQRTSQACYNAMVENLMDD